MVISFRSICHRSTDIIICLILLVRGVVFRRQTLTSRDVRLWRLKTVPALKGLTLLLLKTCYYMGYLHRPVNAAWIVIKMSWFIFHPKMIWIGIQWLKKTWNGQIHHKLQNKCFENYIRYIRPKVINIMWSSTIVVRIWRQ